MSQARESLPAREQCLQWLRDRRFGDRVACLYCDGTEVMKKGRTDKSAQRYRCSQCGSYFNDLTGTVFAGHQLSVGEMYHIIREMDRQPVRRITEDLDRTYKTTLEFVHEVEHRDSELLVGLREAGKFPSGQSRG
jgi:transposase-like protein